jgi:hypothetical protein
MEPESLNDFNSAPRTVEMNRYGERRWQRVRFCVCENRHGPAGGRCVHCGGAIPGPFERGGTLPALPEEQG